MSKTENFTYYWYDYETFGIDPALDRPAQFAGQRTNADLEPIGEPLLIYNRLTPDYLPDPGSCKITGISPHTVEEHGLPENQFIQQIHRQLALPGTCNVGYNNIRFDDEFTRFTLFRNFYDPYQHEWAKENSRWDLLDVVRMTRALRPDGIEWPHHEDGNASNRLEDLTQANGIAHADAHDALSDVHATIALARLIRDKQPRLFDFAQANRRKDACRQLLRLDKPEAVVHVSGMIPSEFHHLAVVVALAPHPGNNNGVVVFNLMSDPDELITLAENGESGVEEIAKRLFTRATDLEEGIERLPLKTIHVNRTPVLAPRSVLREEDAERLNVNLATCNANLEKIRLLEKPQLQRLRHAIGSAMQSRHFNAPENVEATLYSGPFFSREDKQLFDSIRSSKNGAELTLLTEKDFADKRASALLFRYRARNFPDTLSADEKARWQQHCKEQLESNEDETEHRKSTFPRTIDSFRETLSSEGWQTAPLKDLRDSLLSYADTIEQV